MSSPQPPGAAPTGRQQRRLKNFLLDARFQLKFAAYFVFMTLVIASVLGVFLVRTTDSLFSRMNDAVDARSKAAQTNRELGTCSLNNELAKNMDDPDFAAKLAEKSKAIDDAFERETQAVIAQRALLEKQQQLTVYILVGLLVGFIALVAFGAIVITHRIVGPLFRIKRMAREVGAGVLRPPTYGLRPTDELQDVFEIFSAMVTFLRGQAEADLEALERATQDPAEAQKLREEFEKRLARKS
jgi:nitrogen fixation/metabolism regulation signal transduction histidine kinase